LSNPYKRGPARFTTGLSQPNELFLLVNSIRNSARNTQMTTSSGNILDSLVIGYPKLAGQMSLIPELQIFRNFGALNARNLLYLQAELEVLEKKLIEKETENSRDPRNKRNRYAIDFEWLNEPIDDEDTEQRDLVRKIQEVLEKYSK